LIQHYVISSSIKSRHMLAVHGVSLSGAENDGREYGKFSRLRTAILTKCVKVVIIFMRLTNYYL